MIEVVTAIKALSPADRIDCLTDPSRFLRVLDDVNEQGAAIQRFSLEHLLFPNVFAPVVSREHRADMLLRLTTRPPEEVSVPQSLQLAHLFEGLQPNVSWAGDQHVDAYLSPHLWRWSAPSEPWNGFTAWCRRFAREVNLDSEERQFAPLTGRDPW